jgi:hypothetical protein
MESFTGLTSDFNEKISAYWIKRMLCKRHGVTRIDELTMNMSKEEKAELFLLGAAFQQIDINGIIRDTIVYGSILTVLPPEF